MHQTYRRLMKIMMCNMASDFSVMDSQWDRHAPMQLHCNSQDHLEGRRHQAGVSSDYRREAAASASSASQRNSSQADAESASRDLSSVPSRLACEVCELPGPQGHDALMLHFLVSAVPGCKQFKTEASMHHCGERKLGRTWGGGGGKHPTL